MLTSLLLRAPRRRIAALLVSASLLFGLLLVSAPGVDAARCQPFEGTFEAGVTCYYATGPLYIWGFGKEVPSGVTLNGSDGNDYVQINNGTFNGGGGNDSVDANKGTFNGGDGNDFVSSNSDGGTFNGGTGDDSVSSNSATFNGGPGDDWVIHNLGTFNGGAGNDWVLNNYGTFYPGPQKPE